MSQAATAPPCKKKAGPKQEFYHSEEVLNSDRFFLVGRGGHGNFHKGNRAVRSLVAENALTYVETPRKDRAQISIGLFDQHPLFQTLIMVTPRDYVLPRLEKDEEASSKLSLQNNNNNNKAKSQGIVLPNGATIPPTLASQKRWLSRARTQSVIEQHGSIDNIRAYPRGVYIEVGRDWAIDIIDHLCREQAHEIRKNRALKGVEVEKSGEGAKTEENQAEPNAMKAKSDSEEEETGKVSNGSVAATNKTKASNANANGARSWPSADMMEAVEGLSALMKSEGSTDSEFTAKGQKEEDGRSPDHEVQEGEPKSGEEDAVVINGGEILARFANDMHFVCGCVGFSVLDNPVFLKLIETYYHEQIECDAQFRRDWEDKLQRLKVRRHVPSILIRAQAHAKAQGKGKFRLWSAQRDESNNGRLQRLSEEVWSHASLIEITDNTALLKQRLESPLRSILMTLKRHPGLVGAAKRENAQRASSEMGETPDSTAGENSKPGVIPEDSKKRTLQLASESEGDWRTSLPASSFDAGELGEPPSGWLFCKERALTKLACTAQVSVVVSNQASMERHFVWEAASRWRKELPAKRFVCWFDAESESSLRSDFERFANNIRQELHQDKKTKTDLSEAVRDFYQTVGESRSGAEFFLVFSCAPDPTAFATWVQPQNWYGEDGRLLEDLFSAIVIVPKQQTPYRWNSDVFGRVAIHAMQRIPDSRWKEEKPWWCELPLPNLPPMFSAEIDASTMDKVKQALEMDGSLVALLNDKEGVQGLPSALANQFVRKWMMEDPSTRFGLWLSARNEETLRKSFVKAICTLTRLDQFEDEVTEDIEPRWLAKELMGLLMQMRKFVPRFQWVVVFSDIPSSSKFEEWFFPSESEWWNSRGRFVFTSSEREVVEVRVGEEGFGDHLRKVPAVHVK